MKYKLNFFKTRIQLCPSNCHPIRGTQCQATPLQGMSDYVVKVVTTGLSVVKRDLISYLPITFHPVVSASIEDSCPNQLLIHRGLQNDDFLILSFLLHLFPSLVISSLFTISPLLFSPKYLLNLHALPQFTGIKTLSPPLLHLLLLSVSTFSNLLSSILLEGTY